MILTAFIIAVAAFIIAIVVWCALIVGKRSEEP